MVRPRHPRAQRAPATGLWFYVKRKDRLQATEQLEAEPKYDVRPAVRKGMVFTHDMADWLSFNIDEAWLAETSPGRISAPVSAWAAQRGENFARTLRSRSG